MSIILLLVMMAGVLYRAFVAGAEGHGLTVVFVYGLIGIVAWILSIPLTEGDSK